MHRRQLLRTARRAATVAALAPVASITGATLVIADDLDGHRRHLDQLNTARFDHGTTGAQAALADYTRQLAALWIAQPDPAHAALAAQAAHRTANGYLYAGDMPAAHAWARRAAGLAGDAGKPDRQALAMLVSVDAWAASGRPNIAWEMLSRARRHAGPWTLARIEARAATVAAKMRKTYDARLALDVMDRAVAHAEASTDGYPGWWEGLGAAWSANRRGLVALELDDHRQAETYLGEVLAAVSASPRRRAQVAVGVSQALAGQHRYDDAAPLALAALETLGPAGDDREIERLRRMHETMPDSRSSRLLGEALTAA